VLPPGELGELEAFRSLLAGAPGGRLAEIGGALCTAFEPTPTAAICNRALGLGQARAAATEDLDAIDAFFAGLGLAYCVTTSPEARPPELAASLEARGFQRGYPWTKFRRAAEPATLVETELRIEHLAAGAGDVFAEVLTRAAGTPEPLRERLEWIPRLPGWHCFVAYADDTPAATGALFVSDPERIGWLGAAGTLPEFRRRGAQSACSPRGSTPESVPAAPSS
jgi:hypothetical protein